MAQVVFLRPHVVMMPGQQNDNDNGVCTANVVKLQLVQGQPGGIRPNPAGNARPLGIALEKGGPGETIGYGQSTECSGFDTTGINPFDEVGPSAAIAGGLATGADRANDATGQPVTIGRVTGDGQRIKIRTI